MSYRVVGMIKIVGIVIDMDFNNAICRLLRR